MRIIKAFPVLYLSLSQSLCLNICAQTITTIAGNGMSGTLDGPALSATFNRPVHAVPDSKGNIFITDYDNHCIRKLDTNGIVSTFAGTKGVIGFQDGLGANARFYRPVHMVIDANDNLYVCDAKNHAIRKIASNGMVTTLAGNGTGGLLDGIGNGARFNHPYSICFDQNGDLIISDRFNHAIRKLNPNSGQVVTLAGGTAGYQNGPLAIAKFDAPHGLVHDGNGTIYLVDRDNACIRKINNGSVSTHAGSGIVGFQDGALTQAKFNIPIGIERDIYGSLYVTDSQNHALRKITGNQVITIAGNGQLGFQNGNALANCLNGPHGIWVSQDSCPKILIADQFNHAVRVLTNFNTDFMPDTLSFCPEGGKVGSTLPLTNIMWSSGANTDSISVSQSGFYWLSGELNGCTYADTFFVDLSGEQLMPISIQVTICDGDIYTVQIPQLPNQNITWFDGSNALTRTFSSTGSYWVTRTAPCDTLTDTISITVINCDTIPPPPPDTISRIFVPNVFTPNNDGINDFFLIQGTGINDYHIAIFNRWGTLLYESKNMSEAWDGTSTGTDIVEGVYTYLITYRTWNDKYREEYGHVTVFR
jgi:gliding motility-associated-like protein